MTALGKRLLAQQSLTVVCAGNSQAWGQGARGWQQALPDFVSGETRRLPEYVPSFVSLLRGYLQDLRVPDKDTRVINAGVGSTATNKYYALY